MFLVKEERASNVYRRGLPGVGSRFVDLHFTPHTLGIFVHM
jgi:hypothetical protein